MPPLHPPCTPLAPRLHPAHLPPPAPHAQVYQQLSSASDRNEPEAVMAARGDVRAPYLYSPYPPWLYLL